MVDLPIHFVSTLPRSGSTLLINLLGQNPAIHVTPTNDLIEHVIQVRNTWMNHISFKAQGLNNIKPRILDMLKGMFAGFYAHELEAGKTVLDKSRGWMAYVELLEEIFQRKVKFIVTVRAVEDIVASFEKLHRKSALTKPSSPPSFFFKSQTTAGRAEEILSPGGTLGIAINRLRDVLQRGLHDRVIIVPYKKLTAYPREVAAMVGSFLHLLPFRYAPDNVEQLTHEDDTVHGMELHKIRTKIEPEEKPGWIGVLPESLAHDIVRVYADVNTLASGPVIIGA